VIYLMSDAAADVVIVGAGPAGTAAAIALKQRGLPAVLLCGKNPAAQPGETIHPGAEILFETLGIKDTIERACVLRHVGHRVRWEGAVRFQAFGTDCNGLWRGYQIARSTLNAILQDRARSLGVRVVDAWARRPVLESTRTWRIETTAGSFNARYVVDGSGHTSWLARHTGLKARRTSPPLIAWFGWAESEHASRFARPLLSADEHGWSWIAQVDATLCAWTRLDFRGRAQAPDALGAFRRRAGPHGVDVTWRSVESPAGLGYFVIGDAAITFDPLASHGVIRAMLPGITAANCIDRIVRRMEPESALVAEFSRWLNDWEMKDRHSLVRLYSAATQFRFNSFAPSQMPRTSR
jgi:flavin-dependent dehydrogenase